MNSIRWIILIAFSTIITACDVIGYFIPSVPQAEIVDLGEAPPDLYYVSGDSISPIDRGSYCWTGTTTAMCVDMILPSYEENDYLLLSEQKIELLFFQPVPDSVRIGVRGPEWTMSFEYLAEWELMADGRVLLTLPDQGLEGRFILFISAVWENGGDAFYTMPIFLQQ